MEHHDVEPRTPSLEHARRFDEDIDAYCEALAHNLARFDHFELLDRVAPAGWTGGVWYEDHSDPTFDAATQTWVPHKEWIPRRRVMERTVAKVLVQLMPRIRRHGPLHLPPEQRQHAHKGEKREKITATKAMAIRPRYGTVIATSPSSPDGIAPGVDVCFSPQMGIQLHGDVDAFSTGAFRNIRKDQVRIFEVSPRYSELIGAVRYRHVGTEVMALPLDASVWQRATVIEESAVMGGHLTVEIEGSGEVHVLPLTRLATMQEYRQARSFPRTPRQEVTA
jgi:hypothetical protein